MLLYIATYDNHPLLEKYKLLVFTVMFWYFCSAKFLLNINLQTCAFWYTNNLMPFCPYVWCILGIHIDAIENVINTTIDNTSIDNKQRLIATLWTRGLYTLPQIIRDILIGHPGSFLKHYLNNRTQLLQPGLHVSQYNFHMKKSIDIHADLYCLHI